MSVKDKNDFWHGDLPPILYRRRISKQYDAVYTDLFCMQCRANMYDNIYPSQVIFQVFVWFLCNSQWMKKSMSNCFITNHQCTLLWFISIWFKNFSYVFYFIIPRSLSTFFIILKSINLDDHQILIVLTGFQLLKTWFTCSSSFITYVYFNTIKYFQLISGLSLL